MKLGTLALKPSATSVLTKGLSLTATIQLSRIHSPLTETFMVAPASPSQYLSFSGEKALKESEYILRKLLSLGILKLSHNV